METIFRIIVIFIFVLIEGLLSVLGMEFGYELLQSNIFITWVEIDGIKDWVIFIFGCSLLSTGFKASNSNKEK